MPRSEMMRWLGQAAREVRERAGCHQVHIAAAADVSETTVRRFERGQAWPRDLGALLLAYTQEAKVDEREIWELALALWIEVNASC